MTCAAIWDMDGTLVDTAEHHFAAWVATCKTLGREFTRADFAATFGRRNPEILPMLFGARFSLEEIEQIGEDKERAYREAVKATGVALLPGVEELMRALQAAGWHQAVGSSAPRDNLQLMLDLTGAGRYLSAVIGAEDTTRGKPDPQVFLMAAERLNMPPSRCIVFEDAPAGVQAARAGNMKCVGVQFVGHHSEEELFQAGAHRVVHSLAELNVAALETLLGE